MRFKSTALNLAGIGLLLFAMASLVLCSGSFLNIGMESHCDAGAGNASHAQLVATLQSLVLPTSSAIFALLLLIVVYNALVSLQLRPAAAYQFQAGAIERQYDSIRSSLYLVALLRGGILQPKIY